MKVLLVSESYWPISDGGAVFQHGLVQGLVARGQQVSVWAPGTKFADYTEMDGKSKIYRVRSAPFLLVPRYRVSFFPWFSARRVIRRVRPDVVNIHNVYLTGLAAMMWAKHYKIPVVATNHFMPENFTLNLAGPRWLHRPIEKMLWWGLVWLHNRADYVTAPTATAVKMLVDHGLKVPAEAISNGVNTDVFKPGLDVSDLKERYGLKPGVAVLMFLGRLDGEKRIDIIISALPSILAQQPVQLIIAGIGKDRTALEAQAAKLGVTDSVVFTGFVESSDKPKLYDAADVFVIASPAELQSIATMEAMASRKPVVAVDVAALVELCHDGENGYVFPLNDVAALADRVNRLLADPAKMKSFGEHSLSIVTKNHAAEVTIKSYESCFEMQQKQAVAT